MVAQSVDDVWFRLGAFRLRGKWKAGFPENRRSGAKANAGSNVGVFIRESVGS